MEPGKKNRDLKSEVIFYLKFMKGMSICLKSCFSCCHEKEIENMWPTNLISSFPMLLCLFDGNNYKTVK